MVFKIKKRIVFIFIIFLRNFAYFGLCVENGNSHKKKKKIKKYIHKGTLKGYDQVTNIVLEECHERIYSKHGPTETNVLGLYVIRGDNIAVIGLMDEKIDDSIDLKQIRGDNLKPIVH